MSVHKEYDLVVFIGRFQPFHDGHNEIIRRASILACNTLILIGSAESPRTIKDPWTADERRSMVAGASHAYNRIIQYLPDDKYSDNEWIINVGNTVNKVAEETGSTKIAIIGHDKDHTSFYLNYFPQWRFINVPSFGHKETIDSTKIRNLMFQGDFDFIKGVVPKSVYSQLLAFAETEPGKLLKEEWDFIQDYKKQWSVAPYPPIFVTVDAVVVQSGHILLVQRGGFPGKGLWAMPGGFLDSHEKIVDATIRELREETGLKVPEKVLRGSIELTQVFDDPNRSTRGRTITHASFIKLSDSEALPKVRGGSDAVVAKWFPLSEFDHMRSELYEDHWFIVNKMIHGD